MSVLGNGSIHFGLALVNHMGVNDPSADVLATVAEQAASPDRDWPLPVIDDTDLPEVARERLVGLGFRHVFDIGRGQPQFHPGAIAEKLRGGEQRRDDRQVGAAWRFARARRGFSVPIAPAICRAVF